MWGLGGCTLYMSGPPRVRAVETNIWAVSHGFWAVETDIWAVSHGFWEVEQHI